jgi:hypothetical protein
MDFKANDGLERHAGIVQASGNRLRATGYGLEEVLSLTPQAPKPLRCYAGRGHQRAPDLTQLVWRSEDGF